MTKQKKSAEGDLRRGGLSPSAKNLGDPKITPTDNNEEATKGKTLTLETRRIDDLIPFAMNARTHSEEQVGQIARSITEFGWTNPILITPEGDIIAGHGRVLAARKVGIETAPCIVITGLTEAQRKAYILADNKLALNSGWDMKLLAESLRELDTGELDIDLIGFSSKELDSILTWAPDQSKGKGDPDHVPAIEPDPITKPGEVWLMDKHRLLCGDSTSKDAIKILTEGAEVDMAWTDPPYNVAYGKVNAEKECYKNSTQFNKRQIMNDDMTDAQFLKFMDAACEAIKYALKKGGCFYMAHADATGHIFRNAVIKAQLGLKQCLIWVKNAPVLSHGDYNWKHEPILYGWKLGAAHYFSEDFTFNTVFDDDTDLRKLDKKQMLDIIKDLRNSLRTTVIRADKPQKSGEHPTMKPVALVELMIRNSSRRGEVVLDPFGGSGTTLIACEKNGRACRIMELDPKYADVIVKRWQEYTGKKATLAGTKKTFDEITADRLPKEKKSK